MCLFLPCVGCVTFTRWLLLSASALTRSSNTLPGVFLFFVFLLQGYTSRCVSFCAGAKRMCATPEKRRHDVLHLRPLQLLPPLRRLLNSTLLRACLTFHNCIITRSVSSRRKWVQRKFSPPSILIVDPGGMSSSSGRLDSPQHVGQTPAAAAESS